MQPLHVQWAGVDPHHLLGEQQVNSLNNLLSYCGLIDKSISTSDKDLPVHAVVALITIKNFYLDFEQIKKT